MADKPPPPDQNILVYVPDYHNATIQTSINSSIRKQPQQVFSSSYQSYDSPRCDSVRSEAAESTCSSLSSTETVDVDSGELVKPPDPSSSIAPPFGWKRLLTNGVIIYVSPSNTALSSIEQVKAYLQTEGTCKCGLECPFDCDATFNFNPKVLTRPWTAPVVGPGDLTKLCNHKRKLLTQSSLDSLDNRYDFTRRKKRRVGTLQPSVSQLLAQREQTGRDHQSFNGPPWRDNAGQQQFSRNITNGYQEESQFRYQESGTGPFPRIQEAGCRFPSVPFSDVSQVTNMTPIPIEHQRNPNVNVHSLKSGCRENSAHPETIAVIGSAQSVPLGLNVNRTPWQQSRQQNNTYERVPPLHNHNSTTVPSNWSPEMKKKPTTRLIRKRFSEDESPTEPRNLSEQPSFMDDPSGYLAQQTALLNSTISRQSGNCPAEEGVPVASSLNKFPVARPKSRNSVTTRFPDSSLEKRKVEEPSSTLPERSLDDRGPIQGATVSTSNRSPVESLTVPDTVTTVVTTMASGHTVSSNTITSVLAGRTNTATVTVNNPPGAPKQNNQNIQPDLVKSGQQVLVSSNGQLLVANSSMLSPQPKIATTSPGGGSQIGVSPQVINQPTVLVNALQGLLLQPSVVVDGINTVQIPQIVGNVVQNQVIEEPSLLSPDSKRKAASFKKRKSSPTVGPMLLSSQSSNNVMVQQQQINTPMLQALTILPSKTNFAGTQQLITANMLQPLNLVQNFPIQQFIVPAGVSGMVMSDGTILQDAVQLNLLTPVQNSGVFSNGQNLLTPGMVIREPNSQPSSKVMNNQFIGSPNPPQYLVNNTFSGQLSPMLNVSPNQCNRQQEYIPSNVVVQQQQPNTSNTTVVQQNTTIVQQTTMISNQQTHPTPALNLNQNFILTSEKPNFILSPNSEKILISPDNMRGNFMLSNIDKQNFVINNVDKQNLIINNFDKNGSSGSFILDKKNSVSTQTQNQVLQISSSPALVVATSNTMCNTSTFSGSPPDTTTLSPVDQEVTTSLQPNSPDPSSQSLPMVHCVSSSSQQEDGFQIENYNGNMNKSYTDSNCPTATALDAENEDYSGKMSLCNVPDSVNVSNDESEVQVNEE